ncbi:hypothetical protein Asp14428_08030 [Actinoplanes sp. NBRC 14428]|nr:hypothetical protein Asp14428_08030 [Actinoplanes sp. NBRC 14428]
MNAQPGDDEPVRIGLALGGGAVRGAAHVGVLDVLDAAGLAPAVIAGTSAGALIGALYAAGTGPSEISKVAQALRWSRLIRPARTRRALFATARLGAFLDDLLGGRDFDALDLPFAAVACELTTGDRVVLRDGPVASAVLASAAIPGVFPPVERDGRLLVDGSLVDIVPAGLAREMGADVVVAVDVSGPLPRRPRRPCCTSWWRSAPCHPAAAGWARTPTSPWRPPWTSTRSGSCPASPSSRTPDGPRPRTRCR